jgi:hypothetical protein
MGLKSFLLVTGAMYYFAPPAIYVNVVFGLLAMYMTFQLIPTFRGLFIKVRQTHRQANRQTGRHIVI